MGRRGTSRTLALDPDSVIDQHSAAAGIIVTVTTIRRFYGVPAMIRLLSNPQADLLDLRTPPPI